MAVRISKNFRGAQNTRAAFAYLPTLAFHFFAGLAPGIHPVSRNLATSGGLVDGIAASICSSARKRLPAGKRTDDCSVRGGF